MNMYVYMYTHTHIGYWFCLPGEPWLIDHLPYHCHAWERGAVDPSQPEGPGRQGEAEKLELGHEGLQPQAGRSSDTLGRLSKPLGLLGLAGQRVPLHHQEV